MMRTMIVIGIEEKDGGIEPNEFDQNHHGQPTLQVYKKINKFNALYRFGRSPYQND